MYKVAAETGDIYKLMQDNPGKRFHVPTSEFVCANMKLTTLGWVARSLEQMIYPVTVPEAISKKARKALERMIEATQNGNA